MKTFFLKILLLVLIVAGISLIFSACEQEHIIGDSISAIVQENPNNVTEDRSKRGLLCGTQFTEKQIEYLNETRTARRSFERSAVTHYVPIVNHIVRENNGMGGLSIVMLENALTELNNEYEDANIQFFQCRPVNYIDNTTWLDFNTVEEAAMTMPHEVDDIINIYYVDEVFKNAPISTDPPIELCGYAYLPSGDPNNPGPNTVVMSNGCVNNGSTLKHELGHYFSLMHTHGMSNCGGGITTDELVNNSNCATAGDLICDTPADPCLSGLVTAACVYNGVAVDANTQAYSPLTDNIMSYSLASCRTEFTNEQLNWIAYSLFIDRNYLMCTPVVEQITWSYNLIFDQFVVCANPYEGTTHQFRYRRNGFPFSFWKVLPSTTNPCFQFKPKACDYDVQVRIQAPNNQWSNWSDSVPMTCG